MYWWQGTMTICCTWRRCPIGAVSICFTIKLSWVAQASVKLAIALGRSLVFFSYCSSATRKIHLVSLDIHSHSLSFSFNRESSTDWERICSHNYPWHQRQCPWVCHGVWDNCLWKCSTWPGIVLDTFYVYFSQIGSNLFWKSDSFKIK